MVREASRAAFERYVAARTPALSRTAFLLTGDAHLAEDLVQSSLLQAAKAWHRIAGDPEPYVRRIMANQNISRWRRSRSRVAEVPLSSHDDRPGSLTADPDLRLSLDAALRLLTPRQRTVLVLRFYEDLTEVETARILGIGAGTVKSTTREAPGAAPPRRPAPGSTPGGCLMTGQELRDQLARLAEDAPVASVPSDTYRRGRRAAAGSRIAAAALAIGCVAIGTLAVGQLDAGHRTPHPDTSAPAQRQGVPDYLHTAPWLGAVPWSDTLRIGTAAAAFADYGEPTVIDAATGTYHRLPLPGAGNAGTKIALSPNGRYLAWVYWGNYIEGHNDPDQPEPTPPSGVRVADLTTGRVVLEAPWTGGDARNFAQVLSMAWSANSRYVGWEGVAVDAMSRSGPKASARYIGMVDRIGGPVSGRLRAATVPPAGIDTAVNVMNDSDHNGYPTRPIAVTDDGRLIAVAGNTLYGVGSSPQTFPLLDGRLIGAIWLHGSQVMAAENPPRGCCLRVLELPSGRVVRGSQWHGGAGDVRIPAVAGVLASGEVVLRPATASGGPAVLVPTTTREPARAVVQLDEGLDDASFATDLMTPGKLTVPGPTPDWPLTPPDGPRRRGHRTLYGVSGGCAALLLAGTALWWRRRRLTHM